MGERGGFRWWYAEAIFIAANARNQRLWFGRCLVWVRRPVGGGHDSRACQAGGGSVARLPGPKEPPHIRPVSAGRSQGPQARASLGRGRPAPVACSLRTPPGPQGRHLPDCVGPLGLIVVDSPAHRWLAPPAEVVPQEHARQGGFGSAGLRSSQRRPAISPAPVTVALPGLRIERNGTQARGGVRRCATPVSPAVAQYAL